MALPSSVHAYIDLHNQHCMFPSTVSSRDRCQNTKLWCNTGPVIASLAVGHFTLQLPANLQATVFSNCLFEKQGTCKEGAVDVFGSPDPTQVPRNDCVLPEGPRKQKTYCTSRWLVVPCVHTISTTKISNLQTKKDDARQRAQWPFIQVRGLPRLN